MRQQLIYYRDWLAKENYKAFYLAVLRVGISLWLLKEVFINWPYLDILYGHSSYVVLEQNRISSMFSKGFGFIKDHYNCFFIAYLLVILLNVFGIGRWITALFLFVMTDFLHKMNMSFINGGDMMAELVLMYLVFADSHQYLVAGRQKVVVAEKRKVQNMLSNLAAFSIMLQLCVAYFTSAIAKLNTEMWCNGEATYYALSMERFIGTPFNKYLVQHKWFDIISNYAVLAFELLFPVFIWVKKLRRLLLLSGIFFHLGIYVFLMIYGFQVVFVLIYGLFLPNQQVLAIARKLRSFIPGKRQLLTGLN